MPTGRGRVNLSGEAQDRSVSPGTLATADLQFTDDLPVEGACRLSSTRPNRLPPQPGILIISDSIAAYDIPDRVARYDADMDIMHPNRGKMIQVVLDVLPFARSDSLVAVDLGVGTGILTQRFLDRFSSARVIAIDGAASMIELARARLGHRAADVEFVEGDFRRLSRLVPKAGAVDVVVSAYALHHLDRADKSEVYRSAVALLRAGGWFLNADLVVSRHGELEERIQHLRVQGIVERAGGQDDRFADAGKTRRFLDELEAAEGDQPITLDDDLAAVKTAGLARVEVFWKEHREVVFGGPK